MKKVLINFDVSSTLIECPDFIAENFEEYIDGIYDWIKVTPEGAKYKRKLSAREVGCIISAESILEYLNTVCLKDNKEKAVILKEKASGKEKAFYTADF